jgi:hypothetical protein
MDSPLSRSPGSSVFSGVGLPITLPSSVLGGPHRLLEYWGTPPHSSSLLPLPPRHGAFQWVLPEVPSRGWLLPLLDCQLEVGGRAWPWARNRFTSSSLANSAKMVVFPSTHLENRRSGECTTPSLEAVPPEKAQLKASGHRLPNTVLWLCCHWSF